MQNTLNWLADADSILYLTIGTTSDCYFSWFFQGKLVHRAEFLFESAQTFFSLKAQKNVQPRAKAGLN